MVIHGSCAMCGGKTASVEVEIPHATIEKRKSANAPLLSALCVAICRTCARSIAAAWANGPAVELHAVEEGEKRGA